MYVDHVLDMKEAPHTGHTGELKCSFVMTVEKPTATLIHAINERLQSSRGQLSNRDVALLNDCLTALRELEAWEERDQHPPDALQLWLIVRLLWEFFNSQGWHQ